MEVYNFNYNVKNQKNIFEGNSNLLIGEFSVFHIGHKELFDKAKSLSNNKLGITLLEIDNKAKLLPTENELQNLAKIGFDFVILIKFDFDFKTLKANDFIDHIVKKYKVENIIVGEDFRFGIDRMWGVNELNSYFKNTFVCQIKKVNNIKISSSGIIEMVKTGEVKLINDLLVCPYNPLISYESQIFIWNEKLVKLHSGIYFIKIGIGEFLYHGVLHISMSKQDKIKLLNYEEEIIDGIYSIQVFAESRIIINSRMDNIKDEDEKNCLEFFYLLQNK